MEVAYRIAKTKYSCSHDEMFSGTGAAIHGGRWNSKGNAMVYASESRALATLEIAVHLKSETKIGAYSICQIDIPEGLCEELSAADLPEGWDEKVVNPLAAQSWGDLWLKLGATPVVKVPSIIIADEWNYLINPEHDECGQLTYGPIRPHPFDGRINSNPLI